ncbi:MAG: ABC transporter ATP-binding protein [Ilumatobacteraceae bacterium]
MLRISGLDVTFADGTRGVRGATFDVMEGEVVGVAGQSGSGKTVTALSIIGLLPPGATAGGSIMYRDRELIGLSERTWTQLRGREVSMIFQETTTALNPVVRIGKQLMLAARANTGIDRASAHRRVTEMLIDVGLKDHSRVMASYPHELSGGMCQRVMIAMALSCGASLLIADEPTTALDVSVQRDVIDVIKRVAAEHGLAVIFVSHDLGVLEELCDRVVVMYSGEVVEVGLTADIIARPQHPYTQALLASVPRLDGARRRSVNLGAPVGADVEGCRFRLRCGLATDVCARHPDLVAENGHAVRCWLAGGDR